jgi:Suppressor of fused protein (SUFU)
MNLAEHIEFFLGPIQEGWKDADSNDSTSVQIASFHDQPYAPITTFSTIGVSRHALVLPSGKHICQEIVFCSDNVLPTKVIASLLFRVSEIMIQSSSALVRGQTIELPPEAAMKLGFEFLYCTIPVLFRDGFATFQSSEPPTVFVWLVPLHRKEALYAEKHGWEKLEDEFESLSVNLCSSARESVFK